ncbi:Protein PHLOEM PROTEIN 2-LIKE A10 [Rhynchospora pubera]|uniref:Protein PHLOEM PROTEIN 2-LIKE A10 n=1 Tax=Rhynchospora pubera TaxID=906938 RepID=A0AAV8DUT4_9POAL|nr:Protein PHLOEM PROTEIN 2-LIKE A10 [Rhynchospora pubera]
MDLVDLARRRRRFLFFAAASAVAGYGAYRLYNHPTVVRKRIALARLAGALESISDAAAFSADTVALISHDLNRFIRFGGEIPPSLRQLARLATSGEVSASVSRLSQAVAIGVLLGYRHASPPADPNAKSLTDQVLDKVFSDSGAGFASTVAGSFAKNLVVGFYSKDSDSKSSSDSDSGLPESSQPVPKWVNVVCSEPCKETITDVVQAFISTAVAVFLDKTIHMNTFDDVFSGLTNPKHEQKMKEMLVSVCNGAVETLVKTSHDVYTKQGTSTGSNLNKIESDQPSYSTQSDKSGWVDTVSSTLAVPSNRRFVLDVTGRITFETVRSFLEFVLWKVIESARSGASAIREEILEVMKYLSAKSMLVVTVCVSLCMHVMSGTRVLVPA